MGLRKSGLLKWPGGKESEIEILKEYFPTNINNYYEPFVGGGSVYLNTVANKYYINDLYDELYYFYKLSISEHDDFKIKLNSLDSLWKDVSIFFERNKEIFEDFFIKRHDQGDVEAFTKNIVSLFKSEFLVNYSYFNHIPVDFEKIIYKTVSKKIKRILKHENEKGYLNAEDLDKNFKSSLKAAIYTYIRAVYNFFRLNKPDNIEDRSLYIACFYFIRNYCYSSMFRFNKSSEFNVPYGGLSYNENYLRKKIDYIYQKENTDKFHATEVFNLDFEEFINQFKFQNDDFIFLDPPYDTDFSSYAENIFNKDAQERLATSLLGIKAKWLLVIKHTDFIQNLYEKPGINIEVFDKKYRVSFKNRNDQNAQHLIIRNYI